MVRANNARRRELYAQNLERERKRSRDNAARRQREMPEAVRAARKKFYNANADRINDQERQWRRDQPSEAKDDNRKRYEASKDNYKTRAANRKARQRNAPGNFTTKQWKQCVLDAGSKCQHCDLPGAHDTLTKDHIVPVNRGGTNWIENIQPLCFSCNARKRDRLESELDYLNRAA